MENYHVTDIQNENASIRSNAGMRTNNNDASVCVAIEKSCHNARLQVQPHLHY